MPDCLRHRTRRLQDVGYRATKGAKGQLAETRELTKTVELYEPIRAAFERQIIGQLLQAGWRC
jgi:hypothetical protein